MSFFRREPHEHRRGHDPGLTVGRALGDTMYHFRDNVSLQSSLRALKENMAFLFKQRGAPQKGASSERVREIVTTENLRGDL